jgi:hypothetical protein
MLGVGPVEPTRQTEETVNRGAKVCVDLGDAWPSKLGRLSAEKLRALDECLLAYLH